MAWASYHKKALLDEIADAQEKRCIHNWKTDKEIFSTLRYEDEFDKEVVDLLAVAIMVGTKDDERREALQRGSDRALSKIRRKKRA